jgi:hypothetical protein
MDWQEHVISGLTGSDLVLLERLWENSAGTIEQVTSCIQELAVERGWTTHQLQAWGVAEFSNTRYSRNGHLVDEPPRKLRRLWAQGVVQSTTEYGIELHPSALCVLNRSAELQHRLWRGQAHLLLPTLMASGSTSAPTLPNIAVQTGR